MTKTSTEKMIEKRKEKQAGVLEKIKRRSMVVISNTVDGRTKSVHISINCDMQHQPPLSLFVITSVQEQLSFNKQILIH